MLKNMKAGAPSNAPRNATPTVVTTKTIEQLKQELAEAIKNEIGDYVTAVANLKAEFLPLKQKAKQIKSAFPEFVPPWSTFPDLSAVKACLKTNGVTSAENAATTADIAAEAELDETDVQRLLTNGSEGNRPLFAKSGSNSWYLKEKKV